MSGTATPPPSWAQVSTIHELVDRDHRSRVFALVSILILATLHNPDAALRAAPRPRESRSLESMTIENGLSHISVDMTKPQRLSQQSFDFHSHRGELDDQARIACTVIAPNASNPPYPDSAMA
ncbi:hypothetical protein PISL3812_09952 [Talaromyces islandicus]|uniref:Uncharacterized protein n=1 Tax=Talaromyces islandicus TaxID=28573 RepID=A0A0U1MBA2_TALIS|nr:hypothetical protein PISL3812_09952 [Talaromyces islandicus]